MIPVLQTDYYKYTRMFKGNYLKGATLLRSLLNDKETREHILQCLPALSAIFTDFSTSEATKLCYNVLSEKGYLEQAIMAYLKGIGETEYDTMDELMKDAINVIEIICNDELYPLIQEDASILKKLLKQKATLDEIRLPENTSALFHDDVLSTISSIATRSSVGLYTLYQTFTSDLNGTTTPFSATESYYYFTPDYNWMCVDNDRRFVFMPVTVRTKDSSTGDYYYYPTVFKYNIASKAWSILYVAKTDVKLENSAKSPKGIAYDSENDLLYFFYRPDATTQMNCDIIKGTTGATVQTEINVGAVGTTSYLTTYFCAYDKDNGVAKFVWSANAMDTKDTTCGWLYGCSVDANGIVWQGIVAMPSSDAPDYYYNEMSTPSAPYRARCSKGCFAGTFSATSASDSVVYMAFVTHSGTKMVVKYVALPASTDYSEFKDAQYSYITEDGLLMFHTKSGTYGGSTVSVLLIIDIPRGKLVKAYTSSTYNEYTLYVAPVINKLAFTNESTEGEYTIIGLNGSGSLVTHTTTSLPSVFVSQQFHPLGTDRYRLNLSSSSVWYLYDYKGGFI